MNTFKKVSYTINIFFNLIENIKLLITGGTGSFGKALLKEILNKKKFERIVIYSRDELKQWELQQLYPENKYPHLKFFIGDIRDKNRLKRALENINTVIHAAALKQVPASEYNSMEFIKTNILGSDNLIQACLDSKVKNVVSLSTDKAAGPVNLYGATKLCSDKLFIAANQIKGNRDIKFSIVRYGNVMGSRGSVIPFFLQKIKEKEKVLPITSKEMTRFNISLSEGVKIVLLALEKSIGGEIFIPKLPSYRITDLAEAIGPSCEKTIIGIRHGEKVHEDLITSAESFSTVDIGNLYAILPISACNLSIYEKTFPICKKVPLGFQYNSGKNIKFLNINELRVLIKKHIYKEFKPL